MADLGTSAAAPGTSPGEGGRVAAQVCTAITAWAAGRGQVWVAGPVGHEKLDVLGTPAQDAGERLLLRRPRDGRLFEAAVTVGVRELPPDAAPARPTPRAAVGPREAEAMCLSWDADWDGLAQRIGARLYLREIGDSGEYDTILAIPLASVRPGDPDDDGTAMHRDVLAAYQARMPGGHVMSSREREAVEAAVAAAQQWIRADERERLAAALEDRADTAMLAVVTAGRGTRTSAASTLARAAELVRELA